MSNERGCVCVNCDERADHKEKSSAQNVCEKGVVGEGQNSMSCRSSEPAPLGDGDGDRIGDAARLGRLGGRAGGGGLRLLGSGGRLLRGGGRLRLGRGGRRLLRSSGEVDAAVQTHVLLEAIDLALRELGHASIVRVAVKLELAILSSTSPCDEYALHEVVDGVSSGDVLASVAASRAARGRARLSGSVSDTITASR